MKTLTAAQSKKAVGIAVLSALLYALYPPIAKVVLHNCSPIMLSALLYIGTGVGMAIILPFVYWLLPDMKKEASLARTDIPTLIAVVVVNIAAGILMNIGIELSTAASASLLGNFEVVATTILAFLFFHKKVGRQLWLGVGLVFLASCVLSTDVSHLTINWGSILVILATFCWGLENNFTRVLSVKNPIQIVIVKGMGVGLGTLIVALIDQKKLAGSTDRWDCTVAGFPVFWRQYFLLHFSSAVHWGCPNQRVLCPVALFINVYCHHVLTRKGDIPIGIGNVDDDCRQLCGCPRNL
nr:EamA family transporter [Lentilactobacillus dabitei]